MAFKQAHKVSDVIDLPVTFEEDELSEAAEEIAIDKNRYLSDGSVIKAGRFAALSVPELEQMPPIKWLVNGWFTRECVGVLRGDPGIGKTFLLLDTMLNAATGNQVAGRFEVKEPLRCLYIASEGRQGLAKRIIAAKQKYNEEEKTLINENFFYVPEMPKILEPTDIPDLISTYKDAKIDLLILDTLSTSIPGEDENSTAVMSAIVDSMRNVGKALQCAVIIVHHNNKQGGQRGNISLLGNTDFMFNATGSPENCVKLGTDKAKDGASWAGISYKLDVVQFSNGETTCVVRWLTEDETEKATASKNTTKAKVISHFENNLDVWMTIKMISNATGVKEDTVRTEISRMKNDDNRLVEAKAISVITDGSIENGKIRAYKYI